MSKKTIAARRARTRELEIQEAAARCRQCKRPLSEVTTIYEDFLRPGKFCSHECMADHLAGFSESGKA